MFSVARAVRAPEWGAEYPVAPTPRPLVPSHLTPCTSPEWGTEYPVPFTLSWDNFLTLHPVHLICTLTPHPVHLNRCYPYTSTLSPHALILQSLYNPAP